MAGCESRNFPEPVCLPLTPWLWSSVTLGSLEFSWLLKIIAQGQGSLYLPKVSLGMAGVGVDVDPGSAREEPILGFGIFLYPWLQDSMASPFVFAPRVRKKQQIICLIHKSHF